MHKLNTFSETSKVFFNCLVVYIRNFYEWRDFLLALIICKFVLVMISSSIINFNTMKKILFTLIAALLSGGFMTGYTQNNPDTDILYTGTYSQRGSEGIYVFQFNRDKVTLELLQTVSGKDSPNFLAIHPNNDYLYAVHSEGITPDTKAGTVTSYEIGSSGKLTKKNEQSSEGSGPCHVSVDPKGEYIYVSNYGAGSLSVYPVHQDGTLGEASDVIVHEGSGPNSDRQSSPHNHSAIPAENGHYVYASDLGADKIIAYKLNREKGTLSTSEAQCMRTKPGGGPRHFDIHPSGNYAYSVEELTSHIAAYSIDQSNGSLKFIERESLIPGDFSKNNTGADIQVSPDGEYVYASNRGHNSLAIYSIDQESGELTSEGHASTHGETPRNFLIDQNGEFIFVAHQNSDNIVVLRRDQNTGKLEYTGKKASVPAAVCIQQLQ